MSWVAVAIGGSAALSAVMSNQNKTSGKIKTWTPPETDEAILARKRLTEIAQTGQPDTATREIAEVQPLGEERQLARTTATELAQPQDIFSLPEVQGIIQQSEEQGNLLVNRLGRMLKASGNLTSTTGRDVLGRTVSDVQGRLAAELAPFASEERERRRLLIPQLEGLGMAEEEVSRLTEQLKLDEKFRRDLFASREIQDFEIPLLRSIIGDQPSAMPIIPGGGGVPNTFAQMSPIIGQLLAAQINRQPPAQLSPGQPTQVGTPTTTFVNPASPTHA